MIWVGVTMVVCAFAILIYAIGKLLIGGENG